MAVKLRAQDACSSRWALTASDDERRVPVPDLVACQDHVAQSSAPDQAATTPRHRSSDDPPVHLQLAITVHGASRARFHSVSYLHHHGYENDFVPRFVANVIAPFNG